MFMDAILYITEVICALFQEVKEVTNQWYAGADVGWLLGIASGEEETLKQVTSGHECCHSPKECRPIHTSDCRSQQVNVVQSSRHERERMVLGSSGHKFIKPGPVGSCLLVLLVHSLGALLVVST